MTVTVLGSDKPCLLDEGHVFILKESSVQENLKDCLHLDRTWFYSKRVLCPGEPEGLPSFRWNMFLF